MINQIKLIQFLDVCWEIQIIEKRVKAISYFDTFHLRPKNVSYNTRLSGNEGQYCFLI